MQEQTRNLERNIRFDAFLEHNQFDEFLSVTWPGLTNGSEPFRSGYMSLFWYFG